MRERVTIIQPQPCRHRDWRDSLSGELLGVWATYAAVRPDGYTPRQYVLCPPQWVRHA